MLNRTGLVVLCGLAGAIACGSSADGNFSNPTGTSGQTSMGGGSSGKGGSAGVAGGGSGKGGSSGSSSGGKAGAGGTSGGAAGASGGTTGGTAPDTGGTGGTSETGGTTGVGGATGGSGGESGGAGGSGAMAGTGAETGGTTGGTGDTGGTGGSGAGDGGRGGSSMNPDCVPHVQAYQQALQVARRCNANSAKDQCTQPAPSDFECGCSVWVNPQNEEAVDELEQILRGLPDECVVLCPGVLCFESETATCVGHDGGQEGTCGPAPAAN